MKSLDLGRYVLAGLAFAAMLAGCGGSQPPVEAPGATPQSVRIATHADRSGSWMLPEGTIEDLIYVSARRPQRGVVVLSYPKLQKVGQLQSVGGYGLCADSSGNVFIPSYNNGTAAIYEYAHGGTSPVAELNEPSSSFPVGCAIDPTTGNLAVTNDGGSSARCTGPIDIFPAAQAPPTVVCTNGVFDQSLVGYCGYDDIGDLFVDGEYGNFKFAFAELHGGSSALEPVALRQRFRRAEQVQWDGKHMTIEEGVFPKIYELKITGTTAKVVATTSFTLPHNAAQSWIQRQKVFLAFGTLGGASKVGFWKYPAGGDPMGYKTKVAHELAGITLSIAPSR
jgi:hypothetical protein